MIRLTAALAALALSGTAALASGPAMPPADPYVPPPPQMAYDWTGGYIGLGLTYGSSTHPLPGPGTLPNTNGAGIGGVAGYNWQSGNMVFGAELNAVAPRMRATEPCTNPTWDCSSDVNNLVSARGRIGVAQGETLLFMTLGVASGSFTHTTFDGTTTYSRTNRVPGGVVGVGIERAMAGGWNVRGDLEHYRFRRQGYALDAAYPNVRAGVTLARISAVMRF